MGFHGLPISLLFGSQSIEGLRVALPRSSHAILSSGGKFTSLFSLVIQALESAVSKLVPKIIPYLTNQQIV